MSIDNKISKINNQMTEINNILVTLTNKYNKLKFKKYLEINLAKISEHKNIIFFSDNSKYIKKFQKKIKKTHTCENKKIYILKICQGNNKLYMQVYYIYQLIKQYIDLYYNGSNTLQKDILNIPILVIDDNIKDSFLQKNCVNNNIIKPIFNRSIAEKNICEYWYLYEVDYPVWINNNIDQTNIFDDFNDDFEYTNYNILETRDKEYIEGNIINVFGFVDKINSLNRNECHG